MVRAHAGARSSPSQRARLPRLSSCLYLLIWPIASQNGKHCALFSAASFLPTVLPILAEYRRRRTRLDGLVLLRHFRSKSQLCQAFRTIPMVEMRGLEPRTPYMRSRWSGLRLLLEHAELSLSVGLAA